MPARVSRALRRYRHGPGSFKVEFAVEGGVPWTHEDSRRALSEFAAKEIIQRYAGHITAAEPLRRAALAATQGVGMAILRYVIRAEPVVRLRREDIVADLGQTVQRYLTGPLSTSELTH